LRYSSSVRIVFGRPMCILRIWEHGCTELTVCFVERLALLKATDYQKWTRKTNRRSERDDAHGQAPRHRSEIGPPALADERAGFSGYGRGSAQEPCRFIELGGFCGGGPDRRESDSESVGRPGNRLRPLDDRAGEE